MFAAVTIVYRHCIQCQYMNVLYILLYWYADEGVTAVKLLVCNGVAFLQMFLYWIISSIWASIAFCALHICWLLYRVIKYRLTAVVLLLASMNNLTPQAVQSLYTHFKNIYTRCSGPLIATITNHFVRDFKLITSIDNHLTHFNSISNSGYR